MGPVHVWDLNLDAEYELQARSSYTRSRAAAGFVAEHASSARVVLAPGDLTLDELDPTRALPAGAVGRAWCPTPGARRRLAEVGVELEPSPGLDVLRAVNDRGFCAGLGQELPGAVYSRELEPLLEALASSGGPEDWLAKRAFGVAGRARRKLRRGAPSPDELAWLEASLRLGGVQLEPFVEVLREFTVQGWVSLDGSLTVGGPRVQCCDAQGAWQETRDASPGELEPEHALRLVDSASEVARALAAAAYFGPFGLDGYLYRVGGEEAPRLQPRSEVNARYTLGWHAL